MIISIRGGGSGDFDHVIALMLGGFAIETLLKMVIVADHCDANGFALDSKNARDFLPTTHDLPKLSAKAKLRINEKDRVLLASLSRFTVWAGRYPIPLLASNYHGPAIFDGIGSERIDNQRRQWKQYDTLYRKLHRLAVRKTFKGQIARRKAWRDGGAR